LPRYAYLFASDPLSSWWWTKGILWASSAVFFITQAKQLGNLRTEIDLSFNPPFLNSPLPEFQSALEVESYVRKLLMELGQIYIEDSKTLEAAWNKSSKDSSDPNVSLAFLRMHVILALEDQLASSIYKRLSPELQKDKGLKEEIVTLVHNF